MIFKDKPKRALAGILALAISVPAILGHVYINSMAVEKCTQEHEWTGLNFSWTNIPDKGKGAIPE